MTNDVKVQAPATKKPKKKKIASLDRRKARAGWFFILPFLIGFVLIYFPMILDSITMSFQTPVNMGTGSVGQNFEWVGLKNYQDAFFTDSKFVENLLAGLQQLALEIPAILIFSLFMAVMLNQKAAGRGLFRAIFFIPVVLSTGIMETFSVSSDYEEAIDSGAGGSASESLVSAMDMAALFANMKIIGGDLVVYITDIINNIFNIVNRSGVQMLIFLAGLQSISPAIYESCKIDGATAWETFWKITFPMISPMILVNGVYTVIDSFTTDSNVVMSYIAEKYAESQVLSSAMAWTYFLIIVAIVGLMASILSAFVFYQRKND